MKRRMKFRMIRWCGVLVSLQIACALLAAQERAAQRPEIMIIGYEIKLQEFEKPIIRINEKGEMQRYTKAYVVYVKGSFGEPRAIPVEIYIGDYRVPEYGGMKDGIYFRIYEDTLLQRLEGKPFGYGYEGQKLKTFEVPFTPSKNRPFKKEEGRK